MAASQINTTDTVTGASVGIDTELVGGKHHPSHGVRDGMDEALGAKADAAAGTDAGTFSLIALVKRLLGKLPSTLGSKTAANSLSVTLSSDDDVLIGAINETPPASDIASSGLNGRLQRLAQRVTALLSSTSLADASRVPVDQRDGLALSGTAVALGVLFTQDMLGYESATVQITSAGVGCTITYETSDDNINWLSTAGLSVAAVGATASVVSSTSAIGIRFGNLLRYFRARVSTYGSGTVTVVGYARKAPAFNALPVSTITGNPAVVGAAAHDAAIAGAPVRLGARALTANYSAVSSGDVADLVATLVGAAIYKPFSIPENDWSYPAAAGGEVATGDIAVKTAAGAGLRNYITWLTVVNAHATVDTEFVVKDGATVIYRGFVKAGGGRSEPQFPSTLKSSANTALNIACITTGAQVYFNCGGYAAP
ncbi:hypothetical protein [Mesorhizobium sp. M0959]|uniref:hypothetical protein n=1 Tax=unclassified Mesorhizobium TaxID=325217 RepID=UPI00333984BA